jgi:uncharacterized iron-regulated membrane protein
VPTGGVLRTLPRGLQVLVGAVTVAVGVAFPLLGATLLAVLLLESLLDTRRTTGETKRRGGRPSV